MIDKLNPFDRLRIDGGLHPTIKNYLGVAVIISSLLLGLAAWRYASSYAEFGNPGGFRSFSVSAEGKEVAIPDVAQFSFSVITEGGKDVGALQSDNTKKMNAVINFVKSKGVDAKDIETQNYSVEPRYQNYVCNPNEFSSDRVCPPPEIVGYTIRQNISVKIRDFSRVGDALSGVVEQGANSVSGLYFTIDDPAEVQAKARAKAISKAKEKAKELAKAGGFRIGRLLSINEGFYPVYGRGIGAAYGVGGDLEKAAPPTIEPGSEDVVVSVNLSYEIK